MNTNSMIKDQTLYVNYTNVQEKLKDFNRDTSFRSFREKYSRPSFFEMMSIGRKENQHSSFLRWLFQANDITVNDGFSPLMCLLDILVERDGQRGKDLIDDNVKNAILTRKLKLSNINVRREVVVGDLKVISESKDRIDIYITCDVSGCDKYKQFEFIIENKVGSKEGDQKLKSIKNDEHDYNNKKQTERYVLGTRYKIGLKPDWIWCGTDELMQFYVFLTPISSVKLSKFKEIDLSDTCESDQFIHINYQDIVNYIIEPLLHSNNLSDRVRVFLNEYINNLSMPCLDDEEYNVTTSANRKTIIMATLNEDFQVVQNFWDKYGCLVKQSLALEKGIESRGLTRQDVFNEYIKEKDIQEYKNYVWEQSGKNRVQICDIFGTRYVKNVSSPSAKIEGDVFKDLLIVNDFYHQNEKLILTIMKILSDQEGDDYNEVRELFESLTNSKDNTKFVLFVKENNEITMCNEYLSNRIKGYNKRELVKTFIENLKNKMEESVDEKRTYKDLFNEILLGKPVWLASEADQLPREKFRYEKYKWDETTHKYKWVSRGDKDDKDFDIFFSNQWGCLDNKKGTFDYFLKMIKSETFMNLYMVQDVDSYLIDQQNTMK